MDFEVRIYNATREDLAELLGGKAKVEVVTTKDNEEESVGFDLPLTKPDNTDEQTEAGEQGNIFTPDNADEVVEEHKHVEKPGADGPDADGVMWDERIHAKTKSVTKDKTFRKATKVDSKLVLKVEQEQGIFRDQDGKVIDAKAPDGATTTSDPASEVKKEEQAKVEAQTIDPTQSFAFFMKWFTTSRDKYGIKMAIVNGILEGLDPEDENGVSIGDLAARRADLRPAAIEALKAYMSVLTDG